MGNSNTKKEQALLLKNKKAFFLYTEIERYECGIELLGGEVKSIKARQFHFTDSHARITKNNEILLYNMHVSAYKFSPIDLYNPLRPRKLLLKKEEIQKIKRKCLEKKLTLIPTGAYLKRGLIKIDLMVGKGKKLYQKKDIIKERDTGRDMDLEIKRSSRY